MKFSDLSQIGEIVNTHGVQGELKVLPTTNYPNAYMELKSMFVANNSELRDFEVVRIRNSNKFWLVTLKGIDTMELAEELKGFDLLIPDEYLVPLNQGEFFIYDLLGAEVVSDQGIVLGKIVAYFETAANGVCEVVSPTTKFLFPTTSEVLKEIFPKDKKVIIKPLLGMIESNK